MTELERKEALKVKMQSICRRHENGEQTVKRFKIFGDCNIFLMPENPEFEPIPVLKGDDFLVLGKVVEVRMEL